MRPDISKGRLTDIVKVNPKAGLVRDLIIYVLLFYPLSSLLKTRLSSLNVLLTGITVLLLFVYYIFNRFGIRQFVVALYIAATLIMNIFIWEFQYFEINMLFYFPFLLLYFEFFKLEKTNIKQFFIDHKGYVDAILITWSLVVFASFFLSSSYVYEGETRGFVSFAGSTFLLSPIAVLVFAISLTQFQLTKKVAYILPMLICSMCILMGTTRTYLVVLLCAWFTFFYINLSNKKVFPLLLLIGLAIFVLIVLASPISDKFIDASNRSVELGMDPLEAFTSGRSVFWSYDLKAILNDSLQSLIFGHGVNWLFYLNYAYFGNTLWAHNDYLQLLSDYGFIGVFIYIWSIISLVRNLLSGKRCSILIIFIALFMWAFNAFFNMFYTYFCASLSFPFFLLVIRCDAIERSMEKDLAVKRADS